ncbi:MAG TPA: DUF1080 domain-containing protein [Gemmataceae bacterium]|jgi:hypothetical protein|nr:DUF1080 domain-containing protein [Gemmataceae bacterium]
MRRTSIVIAFLTLLLDVSLRAQEKPPLVPPKDGKAERIELFNGKNFDGWEGHKELWSIRNGAIVGKNTKPVNVSTYLLTKQKFGDFHLAFSTKLVESDKHTGVAFWGEKAPDRGDPNTYKGHVLVFPMDWALTDQYGRMGLKADMSIAKKVGKPHDWNDFEIFAQGNRIRLVVNGVLAIDWRDPEPSRIKEGPIGLQLHANNAPQEVQFKGLVLTTFPDDKRLEGKKVGEKVPAMEK